MNQEKLNEVINGRSIDEVKTAHYTRTRAMQLLNRKLLTSPILLGEGGGNAGPGPSGTVALYHDHRIEGSGRNSEYFSGNDLDWAVHYNKGIYVAHRFRIHVSEVGYNYTTWYRCCEGLTEGARRATGVNPSAAKI